MRIMLAISLAAVMQRTLLSALMEEGRRFLSALLYCGLMQTDGRCVDVHVGKHNVRIIKAVR